MKARISRRSFLAVSGAIAPAILGAQSKSGSKRPILGSGEHTYEAIHDWGDLPSNIKYGNTHGVCQDSQGHVYIHHTVHKTSQSDDAMVVFDEKGKFVRSWGAEYKGGAHGLHIRKEGSTEYLYMCDTKRHCVVKTTLSGEVVFTLGYPHESPQYNKETIPYTPTNLAIAPNGDISVGDGYGSSYVIQYDKKGKYLRTFGGLGTEPGQFTKPHGIWVDTRTSVPVLTVADRSNHRIQQFTLDGKYLGMSGGVDSPCHFHQRKDVLVVPDLAARVTIVDRDNKVILHLGQGPENFRDYRLQAHDPIWHGKFLSPHSACFDPDGNIFVVEYVPPGRVTKLRKVA